MINAGRNCGCLTIVAPKYDNLDMTGIFLGKVPQHSQTPIYAAIVHEDDLPAVLGSIQCFKDRVI
jgi:hypothetical protein